MEENQKQEQLFYLLRHVLNELDRGESEAAQISILFQMKLLHLTGHGPNLKQCGRCRKNLEIILPTQIVFDIAKGAILCDACAPGAGGRLRVITSYSIHYTKLYETLLSFEACSK